MRFVPQLAVSALLLTGCHSDERSTPTSSRDSASSSKSAEFDGKYPVGKQYAWIRTSKEAIKAELKDGDSAKFKDVSFYSGGGVPITCGKVNAKNGFGGYGGFERFIAAGDSMAVLESQSSDGIGAVWEKFCKHGPEDQAHTD